MIFSTYLSTYVKLLNYIYRLKFTTYIGRYWVIKKTNESLKRNFKCPFWQQCEKGDKLISWGISLTSIIDFFQLFKSTVSESVLYTLHIAFLDCNAYCLKYVWGGSRFTASLELLIFTQISKPFKVMLINLTKIPDKKWK